MKQYFTVWTLKRNIEKSFFLVFRGKVFVRKQFRNPILTALLFTIVACQDHTAPDSDNDNTETEISIRDGLIFPDSEMGFAVAAHIDSLFSIGPDAEANYQASLSSLREKGVNSISTIEQIYFESSTDLYSERAALTETLGELRLLEARDPLLKIARQSLPERISLTDDSLSPISMEAIIRMTAIRGLGHIATVDDVAVEAILEFTKHAELSIQEQAKQSLAIVIAAEKDERRLKRLIRLFPGDYRDWLILKGVSPPAPLQ